MTVRTAAGAVARRLPARLLRAAGGARSLGPATATFERDDGSKVELLAGYRDFVKASWREYWWPAAVLYGLRKRVDLVSPAEGLLRRLDASSALPVPAEELAECARAMVERYPAHVREVRRRDRLGQVVELVPDPADLDRLEHSYATLADQIRVAVGGLNLSLESATVVDTGCGSGYLSFALAGGGAADVTGVDLDPEGYVAPTERALMLERLAGDRSGRVRLQTGDVHALPVPDASVDLVVSATAVEHFADLAAVSSEIFRVLRPGGFVYHGVDPWFGRRGGHSLCTLDFPWGHVRLSESELDRYLARFRAHEHQEALDVYRTAFQRPRLTLAGSREAIARSGLDILEWSEVPIPAADPHRALLDRRLLRDCRRCAPAVTREDLLVTSYCVIARRPRR